MEDREPTVRSRELGYPDSFAKDWSRPLRAAGTPRL